MSLKAPSIGGSLSKSFPFQKRGSVAGGSITRYRDAVLADSPVSYWRMAEAVGPTAADNQAANAGTYVNAPTLGAASAISDTGDKAVTLAAASTQEISVPDSASLDLGDTFTLEAWVKRAAVGVIHAIMSKGNSAYLMRVNASNQLELVKSNISVIVASTGTIDTNYHHVVATKATVTSKLYIDGVDVTGAVTNAAMIDTNTPLRIGSDIGAQFFDGTLDEVAVYNTALSAARIAAHFAAR